MTDQGLCCRCGVTPGWEPSGQVAGLQDQLIKPLSRCGKAEASEDGSLPCPQQRARTVSADERVWQTRVHGRCCARGGFAKASAASMFVLDHVARVWSWHGPALGAGRVGKTFRSPRPSPSPCASGAHVKDFVSRAQVWLHWDWTESRGPPGRPLPAEHT